MRRATLTILLCLLGVLTAVGQDYFRDVNVRKGREFNFHVFSGGTHPSAVRRINWLLDLDELYAIPHKQYSPHIFDQSVANDGSIYGGKTGITEKVYSNSRKLLSIGFQEDSSGATSHYWSKYYNFNPANGDRIDLKDLFTETGYKSFVTYVIAQRSASFRREVARKIEKQFQQEYIDGTLTGCIVPEDLTAFFVRGRTITIDGDGCLMKNQKFDGLEMKVSFSFATFAKHLNAYGGAVFGLSRANLQSFHSTEFPQLLEGAVGGYPIAMILLPQGGDEYWGMYAYLRHGEGIALRGSQLDGQLKLDEHILSPVAENGPLGIVRKVVTKGSLTGRIVQTGFDGMWTDEDKNQQLPFHLAVTR